MVRRLTTTMIAMAALLGGYSVRSVDVAEGCSSTTVNASIFRRNSLWTHEGEQYISFYNAEGHMVLGKRRLDAKECLDDFSLDPSAKLKAAVLSIEGDRRHREYKALDSTPFLKQLISRLGIEVFFLSEEPTF